jgi:RES domain-containing protein
LKIWRLGRRQFAPSPSDAYSGEGAAQRGGRWNSRGIAVAYASENESLALLEYLVHVDLDFIPIDLAFFPAEIPEDAIHPIDVLPEGWNETPPRAATAPVGDALVLENRHLAMSVPSIVIPFARNYIINPRHARFTEIRFDEPIPFVIDDRLARRGRSELR